MAGNPSHTVTEDLRKYLSFLSEDKGFGVVYVVLPTEGLIQSTKSPATDTDKILELIRDYPFFATTKEAQMFAGKVIASMCDKDLPIPKKYLEGLWSDHFYTVRDDENYQQEAYQHRAWEIMSSTNTRSDCFYSITQEGDNFVGVFHCLSNHLTDKDLQIFLEESKAKNLFELTHFYLTRTYPSLINPVVHTGKLKEKTLRVIQLVGYGFSNKEISDAHCVA